MNNQIIENLYELWEQIGNITHKLFKTENFVAVSMDGSDWPNRVFKLKDESESLSHILQYRKDGKIPEIITIPKPNDIDKYPIFKFVMKQKNMALDMKLVSNKMIPNSNIKQIKTEKDAISFADTASISFGYKVDFHVIYKVINNSKNIRLFIYQENNESLGCGIIFFDSNNNAGLHMIGTLPKGRGKGIGKNITESLLMEAKKQNVDYCVLHASLMGESIYKKLGFNPYGEIETYKIQLSGFDTLLRSH